MMSLFQLKGIGMRAWIVGVFFFLGATPALACSLQITTETLLGTSAGSVCASISAAGSDARGPYRNLDYTTRNDDGEVQDFPAITLRPGMVRPLRTLEVIGLGVVNLLTLKVLSVSTASLSFLNGNTINLQIDANGRVSPERICVRQVGLQRLRGFAGNCP